MKNTKLFVGISLMVQSVAFLVLALVFWGKKKSLAKAFAAVSAAAASATASTLTATTLTRTISSATLRIPTSTTRKTSRRATRSDNRGEGKPHPSIARKMGFYSPFNAFCTEKRKGF